jgi:metal-responsive CopG/Arc/MetJ family transcriptional regulator
MAMQKVDTRRLMINLPVELYDQLDEYAHRMNINRTSAVCVLLTQSLNNQNLVSDLNKLVNMVGQENGQRTG